MKALLKVDEEYQISDIYSLDFTIFSSKIKNFLPLSRQTNDNFGDFFSNFQGLSWQKKLKVEFDLDLLDNGTQNLTFFSQFVKIVKVSSLDLSRFHGILRHKI